MAKKNFSAGSTKSGVLNNDGGEKLREIQAKTQYNFKYIPKEIIIPILPIPLLLFTVA